MKAVALSKEKVKIYPNNFDAEQSALCCMLIDGDAANQMVSLLSEEEFYNSKHKKIFSAMHKLSKTGASIDMITVNDMMTKEKSSESGTLTYLADLMALLPSAANYRQYIKILKRDSTLRKVINNCNKIIEEAYNASDADSVVKLAEKLIYSISKEHTKNDLEHIDEAVVSLMEKIDIMAKNKGELRGLMTGFPLLDQKTNGLQNGDLIILAARPSVGKTSYALNIVGNVADNKKLKNKKIAFFSLEMPAVQLAQRLVCNLSKVSMNDVSRGELRGDDDKKVWKVSQKLSNSEIYIDDSSMITPYEILSKVRRLSSTTNGLDLIVVDYLQLMMLEKSRDTSRQETISEISRMLKIIAKEMECPVIVLSQMSRSIESRTDKAPRLSDLRESGAIEQDADIVMFLSREDEQAKNSREYNIILEIAKHRNGELGRINYFWEGPFVKFTERGDQDLSDAVNLKASQE